MDDDRYLWDKSGPPDPEVERLEKLLAPLGHRGEARRTKGTRRRTRLLAAAAVLAAALGAALWFARAGNRADWRVASLSGAPAVASRPIIATAKLPVGEWLETDAASSARISAGVVGEVEVSPNSRLRLVRSRAADHRLALERGSISARIWAPPRLFFVETPSALAVDLGCIYRLTVEPGGGGRLSVDTGWVSLEKGGLEAVVPAEASCRLRPGAGPATPRFDDAAPAFREALDRLDDAPSDAAALDSLLASARPRDSLTLWHLLASLPAPASLRVYDALAASAPPPAGVTREGIARRDAGMLRRWGSQLGLPSPPERLSLWQRTVRTVLR